MNCLYHVLSRDFNIIKEKKVFLKSLKEIKTDLIKILKDNYDMCCGFDFIESINPNPVGIPTIGNLLISIKGDIIARILKIKPVYYVNDMGSNFCKFLLNHRNNKTMPLEHVYVSKNCTEEELLPIRKQIFQHYPEDAKKIRDEIISKIILEYDKFNICRTKLIYESSYSSNLKKLIVESEQRKNGIYYKNIQVATSSNIPLYIAADYFYHKEIDEKYVKKLQIISKDHSKYVKDITSLTEIPWVYCLAPMIYYHKIKTSKRKGNDLKLEDIFLINPNLTKNEVIAIIKLFYMKYEKRDKIDIELLFEQLKNPYILNYLKNENKNIDYESIINSLQESDLDETIRIWANVKDLYHWVVQRTDINKIYKFLEYVFLLPKSEKSMIIHQKMLYLLLQKIGL